jgi:repeat organellar protein-related (fragment)
MKNLEELKEQLSTLQSQLSSKMSELYENNIAYPEMNEEVIELNNQIATLSNEILNSKKDLNSSIVIYKKDNLEKEISDIETQINNRIQELYNEGNQYIETDDTIINLNSKKILLENELSSLKKYIKDNMITSNLERLQNEYKEKQSLLEARQNELYNNGEQYIQMDSKIMELDNELLRLNNEINNLHNKLIVDAYVTKKEELEEKVSNLENNLNNKLDELHNDGNAYPQMDETVIKLNSEIASLNDSIKELVSKYKNNLLNDDIFDTIEVSREEVVTNEHVLTNNTSENMADEKSVSNSETNEASENNLEDKTANNNKEVLDNTIETDLAELERKQVLLNNKAILYNKLMSGERTIENGKVIKTDSFVKRKEILEQKISELEEQRLSAQNLISNSELEQQKQSVQGLINYFPEMKDEEPIVLYNNAIKSQNKEDILKAIQAVNTMENELHKNPILEVLNTMLTIDEQKSKNSNLENELAKLTKEKEELLKLEQDTIDMYTADLNATKEELSQVTEQINNLKVQKETNKENTTSNIKLSEEDSKKVENLPGSSSPTAMIPRNKLEETYKERLENAAKEEPIFHDTEMKENSMPVEETNQTEVGLNNNDNNLNSEQKTTSNEENQDSKQENNEENLDLNLIPKNDDDLDFDLTPEEYKPQIIQSVKKASAKLLEKIKNSKFIELTTKAIEKLREHKVAALAVTSAAFIGIVSMAGISKNNEDKTNTNEITQTTEQTFETPTESNIETPIEPAIETTPVETSEVVATPTDEETSYKEDLSQALSNILNSNSEVYTSADRAINNTNGLQPYTESWQNAEPSAYYKIEDNQLQKMNETEANNYYQDGGNVAVRMDNNGTPIGYVSVDQQENTSSKSM